MKRTVVLIAIFVLLCSCIFRKQVAEQPVITLQRGSCKGTCPTYKISIYKDGTVVFTDGWYVLFQRDTERTRLPLDTLKVLLDEAKRIGYFNFKDTYTAYWIDLPGTTTTVVIEGKIKQVSDFYPNAPKSLISFENHIDRATHSIRWVGTQDDHDLNEKWFGLTTFPGYANLMNQKNVLDSELETVPYDTSLNDRYNSWRTEWEKVYKPVRDSLIRARKIYYRSLTDAQVDSLWQVENGK
jgi:hypothetical protein